MEGKQAPVTAQLRGNINGLVAALRDQKQADMHGEVVIVSREACDVAANLIELYEKVLAGLPNDAIDGGWTAAGICAYAKRLEAERDAALKALARIVTEWDWPIGHGWDGAAFNDAIDDARAALAQGRA